MVRLEKLLWEQAANVASLGRARVISTPTKFFNENREKSYRVAAYKFFNEGVTGVVLRAIEPFLAKFVYRWARNIALQRGLALEDFLLFQDRQLRRDFIWESFARGSLHPYQWVFFKRRRARYYKVERGLRGFHVPEWADQEARSRTLAETVRNKDIWEDFVYREYISELTPTGRFSILNKWTLLDIFLWYGSLKPEAWDRYFQNEVQYEGYSESEYRNALLNAFRGANLNSADGRRQFEEQVERFNSLYPGAIAREGEKIDYNRIYARYALVTGQEVARYDPALIEQLKKDLEEKVEFQKDPVAGNGLGKKVGKETPDFLRPRHGHGLFK